MSLDRLSIDWRGGGGTKIFIKRRRDALKVHQVKTFPGIFQHYSRKSNFTVVRLKKEEKK
jgi:hypothetical protein